MIKTIRGVDFKGKRVLVRCDFNVPLGKKGDILDDFKIYQTLPTIKYLLKARAKIILMSHLDDPKGRIIPELRLDKIKNKLEKYLKIKIVKTDDCIGKKVAGAVDSMKEGEIILLENLRFHSEEEKGDLKFAKKLAGLADVFVNDAFAACHRSHASLMTAKFLPSSAGLLLEKELGFLSGLRDNPKKPLVVILGGMPKNMGTKIKLINRMAKKAEVVLLANLVADELQKKRLRIDSPEKIVVPVDSVKGLDIGPKTLKIFKNKIAKAKTIFWSGPLGKIEEKRFATGTKKITQAIVKSRAFCVAGGGETNLFLKKIKLIDKFSHISTGGDAMLLFLAGEKLPGIEVMGHNEPKVRYIESPIRY